MSRKKVSVVVASYNMGKYLADAIKSILTQTYPVYEINVVDDGSTDNTRGVMEQFQDNPSVRYHFQSNQGQAVAKNRGIQESQGDYIAFCDADDMWTSDKLEKQLPCFDSDKTIGVVHTNFILMSEDGKLLYTPSRTYHSGWISGQLLIDNFVNGMASVVRRECFGTVGLFDESLPMGIDYDLWLRISAHYKIHYIDVVTYKYRQWDGQMSHRHTKRYECAVKIMKKFIEHHPGLVDASTVREAWAHTYVGRGQTLVGIEKNRLSGLRFFLNALRQKPTYLPAWKEIVKLALRWH